MWNPTLYFCIHIKGCIWIRLLTLNAGVRGLKLFEIGDMLPYSLTFCPAFVRPATSSWRCIVMEIQPCYWREASSKAEKPFMTPQNDTVTIAIFWMSMLFPIYFFLFQRLCLLGYLEFSNWPVYSCSMYSNVMTAIIHCQNFPSISERVPLFWRTEVFKCTSLYQRGNVLESLWYFVTHELVQVALACPPTPTHQAVYFYYPYAGQRLYKGILKSV